MEQKCPDCGKIRPIIDMGGGNKAVYPNCQSCGYNFDSPPRIKNTDSEKELARAVLDDNIEKVKNLIGKGVNVNVEIMNEGSVLMYAVERNYTTIIELLLANGANASAVDSRGNTILHKAVHHCTTGIIEQLLSSGADINALNSWWGETPLNQLSNFDKENVQMVEFLINQGAKINTWNNKQETPLHNAARRGHAHIVQLLILRGAYIDAQDSAGNTPLQIATNQRVINIFELEINRRLKLQNIRKESGLCVFCGHRLNLVFRILGISKHINCSIFVD